MNQEPSLLDYLKSLLDPRRKTIQLPGEMSPEIAPSSEGVISPKEDLTPKSEMAPAAVEMEENIVSSDEQEFVPDRISRSGDVWVIPPLPIGQFPWRTLLAFALGLVAQTTLEPPNAAWQSAIWLYVLAIGLAMWGWFAGEWELPTLPAAPDAPGPAPLNGVMAIVAVVLSAVAFWAFKGNRFNFFNLVLWGAALYFTARVFWVKTDGVGSLRGRIMDWLRAPRLNWSVSRWTLLLILVFGVIVFFRYYRLDEVPPQMFSDHAEKLTDVFELINGEHRIFFPRNTGREAFQMYLTAFFVQIGYGISFLALKMGTVTAGTLSLVFIYLLGKEIANQRVGVIAMLLAVNSYWFNVISRVALRFALYPTFVAPVLYFLIRGLRRQNRNDFIWAGVFLGIGLHGYSPFRFVPFLVVIIVGLYLLHRVGRQRVTQTVTNLIAVIALSLVIFLPLARYVTESEQNRNDFSYRSLTRLGEVEREYPGEPVAIFFDNLWDAMTMMAWDDGQTWVHSVPHRPAVDVVSGVLFYLGYFLLFARYLRDRNWEDISLLVTVPVLLLPSVLSLAFPDENPSLNRTGGALIPVFIIAAITFESLLITIRKRLGAFWSRVPEIILVVVLLTWSFQSNYDLVFNQYYEQFRNSSWNTTELGSVIRGFADSLGSEDSAWVIPWPHWVDTRLVGINAGADVRDYAINTELLPETQNVPGPKLFLFNVQDETTLTVLQELYPNGSLQTFQSSVPGKDFMIYLVISE